MNVNGKHSCTRCLRDGKIASNIPFPSEITLGINTPTSAGLWIFPSAARLRPSNLTELLSGRKHQFTPEWNTNWFSEKLFADLVHLLHFTSGAESVHLSRFQKTVQVQSILNASLAMVQHSPLWPTEWCISCVDFTHTNDNSDLSTCVCLGHGDV